MSDIVERLRRSVTKGHEPTDEDAIEAADEIERLQSCLYAQEAVPPLYARIKKLEAALRGIADAATVEDANIDVIGAFARAALEGKP